MAQLDYPVYTINPGAHGTFCVTISNPSTSPEPAPALEPFDWANSTISNGISVSEDPPNAIVPPESDVTVFYTLQSAMTSAGAYWLGFNTSGCYQSNPLLVTRNQSSSSFNDFPGLLNDAATQLEVGCQDSYYRGPLHVNFAGFSGLSMVELRYSTNFSMPFHEVSRSVQSTALSPTEQNITVTLGIQSYGLPVTVQLLEEGGRDNTYIARFANNPNETATTGDPCDWKSPNNYAKDYDGLQVQIAGVTLGGPTLHLQPYSNGTFTFSLRIWNLTGGFTGEGLGAGNTGYVSGGYFAAVFSAYVVWGNSTDTGTFANLDLLSFFPLGSIGQTVSGSCTAPAETNFSNLPWFLTGLRPAGW